MAAPHAPTQPMPTSVERESCLALFAISLPLTSLPHQMIWLGGSDSNSPKATVPMIILIIRRLLLSGCLCLHVDANMVGTSTRWGLLSP